MYLTLSNNQAAGRYHFIEVFPTQSLILEIYTASSTACGLKNDGSEQKHYPLMNDERGLGSARKWIALIFCIEKKAQVMK